MVECDLSDPRLELVTFTSVRMTPDLRNAHIYYSSLTSGDREGPQRALVQASGWLRRELGRRLKLRYVPALRFEFDDSFERAARISSLLRDEPDED